MLTTQNCKMYYSISGNTFSISDRKTAEDICMAPVTLNIDTYKTESEQEGLEGGDTQLLLYRTSLAVPHPIKSGDFFSSDTQCFFINGKNQVLKLAGKYKFRIALYRLQEDPSKLRVIFSAKDWEGTPVWVCL